MKLPYLTKANDPRVKLGFLSEPVRVDCRVLWEDNYQFIVKLITDIRNEDLLKMIQRKETLSKDIKLRMQEFLDAHENTKI